MDASLINNLSAYSKSTILTRIAVVKRLRAIGIEPLEQNNETIPKTIARLNESRAKFSKSGKTESYSRSYISNVISILRSLNPNTVTKKASEFGYQRRAVEASDFEVAKSLPKIEKLCVYCMEMLAKTQSKITTDGGLTTDMSSLYFETLIGVALVITTNLRAAEIFQLKIKDLFALQQEQPLNIKIKKSSQPHTILCMQPLFDDIFSSILNGCVYNLMLREQFKTNTDINIMLKIADTFAKTKQLDRTVVIPTYILMVNVIQKRSNSINKLLHTFYINANGETSKVALGLGAFRKMGTTLIIKNSNPYIAALFNRHASPETSQNNYNFPDTTAAMNSLELLKSTKKTESTDELDIEMTPVPPIKIKQESI
jgi:hypothetical protein